DEGVLAKIVVPEGTADVPVNQLIAVLAGEGEDVQAAAAGAASPSPPRGEGAPRTGAGGGTSTPAARAGGAPKPPPPPAPPPSPRPSPLRGEGAGGAQGAPKTNGHGRIFASPLARRLARQAGIDIARIAGTGPHGRVIARDVEQAKTGGGLRTPAPGMAVPVQAPSDDKIRALYQPGAHDLAPPPNKHRSNAQRPVQAETPSPHFYLTVTCRIDRLLAAREDINSTAPTGEDGKPKWKLSVNDLIIKALALALMKVPDANVTWTEGGMLKHKRSDIGVAVAIP